MELLEQKKPRGRPKEGGDRINFTVRVEPELRDGFLDVVKKNDTTASQLFREYMRQYIKKGK